MPQPKVSVGNKMSVALISGEHLEYYNEQYDKPADKGDEVGVGAPQRQEKNSQVDARRRIAMANPFEDDSGQYIVLVNDEGQYSLWPEFHSIPSGWTAMGQKGKREDCIAWIDENWTDMRPRSLAEAMRG